MSDRGWIKLHRCIIKSEIYQMPPLYLRVFERLILEANHRDKEIPYKEKGSSVVGKKLIQRGERLTSIRDICEWVGWYERGRFKKPSTKTILNILNWLENNGMIQIYGVKGNRRETHYKVINYGVYQSTDDEVGNRMENSKETVRKQIGKRNKNDTKNDKNDKERKHSSFFEEAWKKYPNKVGKGKVSNTKKAELYKIGDELHRCIERYIAYVDYRRKTDFPDLKYQYGSTFFNSGYVDFLDENYNEKELKKGAKRCDINQNQSRRRLSRADTRDWEGMLNIK